MKKIPLTQGMFAIVDDDDFPYLSRFTWIWTSNVMMYVTARDNKRIHIPMTCFVMKAKKNHEIVHKNGNRLDNRKENLAHMTHAVKTQNARKIKKTSSIYKGVSFKKKAGRWCASIKKDGINYYLGTFLNEKDAGRAYNAKAIEIYGENAWQNKNI